MILMVVPGLTGLGMKRGKLFGAHKDHPLLTVKALICSVVVFRSRDSQVLFMKAIKGLAYDKDWLIKNADAVRLERKKATAKARGEYQGYKERFMADFNWRAEKITDLENEVYSLRRVVRGLQLDLERAYAESGSPKEEGE